jgi:hypothetical protein
MVDRAEHPCRRRRGDVTHLGEEEKRYGFQTVLTATTTTNDGGRKIAGERRGRKGVLEDERPESK